MVQNRLALCRRRCRSNNRAAGDNLELPARLGQLRFSDRPAGGGDEPIQARLLLRLYRHLDRDLRYHSHTASRRRYLEFGIYGIIPIPLLAAGIWSSAKKFFQRDNSNHALLASFSVPLLLFLLPVSLISWVKMNWTAPAFIGIFISTAAFYFIKSGSSKIVRVWGKVSVIFLALSFIAVHILILIPDLYFGRGDFFVGWDKLARRVEIARKDMPEPYFICGYEYKTASQLAFHLEDHPETVSNTIIGRPGLQYDYWCDPDTLKGYNAVVVYDERNKIKKPEELTDRFEKVDFESSVRIEKGGKKVTEFYIFRCYNYRGL
jgi:hypothetical protein